MGTNMTISVCMGIYNGADYIEEQLYSILHQTYPPDEVILCDDNSGDNTVEIVQEFISKNKLSNQWKLYTNSENKGYPGNFYYAMGLCFGDIVFLADQDDIWHEEKLEKMQAVFAAKPDAKAVCCKFGLIDASGKNIHTIMKPARSNGSGELRKVSVRDVFYKCEWPGMVVAYNRKWYEKRKGANSYTIPHDFLVCAAAAEEQGFWQMDEELAYHRRHDSNTGQEEHKLQRLLSKRRKIKEISDYLLLLEKVEKEKAMETEAGKAAMQQKKISMQGRCQALEAGKVIGVLENAWRNRSEVRFATVVCDVLICIRRK